ncbi:Transcriptional regulator Rrf2 family protein [Alteracholeplasma palmae J233]|uniref:Transcriptional regulator Rrf2 family protein n=1 Tax=Alteracholeplasma palmae (strain ATCC 49389 / J233) TaxID=1318466 RepID=U4KK97_ALTPJ|nr:Rrf2 family transcriptional regulator [Alteracholeplasma palmae]CCV63938.1 Transcriptional regulator Rrf2 family protein [Alteracholeplasma palmae J233]
MKFNQQYGVALHILSYMDLNKDKEHTSISLSESVNTNPVVIRRILSKLAKAGLVLTKRGVSGITLLKEGNEITLLEVYCAIEPNSVFNLHPNPNRFCPIGAKMNDAIDEVLVNATNSLEQSLKQYYVSDISKKVTEKIKEEN